MRRSIATPCPINESRVDALKYSQDNDTTVNLNFTSTFGTSFRDSKPRRRQTAFQFTIHEDEECRFSAKSAGSLLEQPARRKHGHSSIQPKKLPKEANTVAEYSPRVDRRISGILVPPKRLKSSNANATGMFPTEQLDARDPDSTLAISRPARRKSIFIPADDTTMPSMYMGIFSPVKNVEISSSQEHRERQIEITGIAACMLEKKRRRISTIEQRARRVPLQTSSLRQDAQIHHDHAGAKTGKENVPPGMSKAHIASDVVEKQRTICQQPKIVCSDPIVTAARDPPLKSTFDAPTKSQLSRKVAVEKHDRIHSGSLKIKSRPMWNAGLHVKSDRPMTSKHGAHLKASRNPTTSEAPKPHCRVPSRLVTPLIEPRTSLSHHKLLTEHITNPALYEDDWLSHQELAVTHLVNDLFKSAQHHEITNTACPSIRERLLSIYNQPENEVLRRRIQAALLYGALSMPQEVEDDIKNLQYDVGRRKAFLDFWLNAYDPHVLVAALEIVVGRQVHPEQQCTPSTASIHQPNKRTLIRQFIEAFFIRADDHIIDIPRAAVFLNQSQVTVLRSLMLIKILDLYTRDLNPEGSHCLFSKTSSYKSSNAALQALMRMLNPTIGDAVRALKHLDYELSYEQQVLQEYEYEIRSLAVDMRDGIRLTRLVELLLYPSTSRPLEVVDTSETSTIFMPEGEKVEVCNFQKWPLSGHLKYPCIGRATKLWNVQIALEALKHVKGVGQLIDNITAEDIVDGFREKTMRLLWSLVGKWGLSGLLDWQDVKWELNRQLRKGGDMNTDAFLDESAENQMDLQHYQYLLKEWARAIALNHGLRPQNFSTSFSDGRIFAAILDEYEPHITTPISQSKKSLQERLCNLGCSKQFSELFPTSIQQSCHIFSKDFVLAALAFLCSRLLGPSKLSRSTLVIQRAWRQYWVAVDKKRKLQKKDLAIACAEYVNNKVKLNYDPEPLAGTLDAMTDAHQSTEEDIWLSLK